MSHRIEKINALIMRHLGEIFTREINLKPGVFITISRVDTTSDLRYTHIFLSVFPEKEASYALKTLHQELYQIQGKLNKKLFIKPLPHIKFIKDETESKAAEVEKILKKINS